MFMRIFYFLETIMDNYFKKGEWICFFRIAYFEDIRILCIKDFMANISYFNKRIHPKETDC